MVTICINIDPDDCTAYKEVAAQLEQLANTLDYDAQRALLHGDSRGARIRDDNAWNFRNAVALLNLVARTNPIPAERAN